LRDDEADRIAARTDGPIALTNDELDRIAAGTTGLRVGLVNLARDFNIDPLNVIEIRIELQGETPGTQVGRTFTHTYNFGFDTTAGGASVR
jgi:hypothetical protein